jgi:hypothetical protein
MNTLEARARLLELSQHALEIVERLAAGSTVTAADRGRMREILRDAREVVYDAGYPGEFAWRAILRASVHTNAPPGETTQEFWQEIAQELRDGMEPLGLVSNGSFER